MLINDKFLAAVQEVKDLEEQVKELCLQRGQLTLSEVERMASVKEKRPWGLFASLEESGFRIDLNKAKLYPPMSLKFTVN